ncbi:MAG: hypothetical protein RQ741_10695 [Wenzhouxiangellaceae bacterium]|nr:hypothetical protein [Wenzhouxiangellaceae bacterium]
MILQSGFFNPRQAVLKRPWPVRIRPGELLRELAGLAGLVLWTMACLYGLCLIA